MQRERPEGRDTKNQTDPPGVRGRGGLGLEQITVGWMDIPRRACVVDHYAANVWTELSSTDAKELRPSSTPHVGRTGVYLMVMGQLGRTDELTKTRPPWPARNREIARFA